MKKIKKVLQILLPGIFLIGYNVGTGSVTSMAKSGASFGPALLWAILLSCVITFYLLDRFSLYTIVTGKTIIQGIKTHIHRAVSWFLSFALVIIILGALLGIMGILTNTIHEGITMLSGLQFSPVITGSGMGVLIFGILITGTNKTFENVMAGIVGIMGLSFLIAAFYLSPSLADLGKGLIPSIPEAAEGSDNTGFVVIAGMTGTTVSAVVFIIRTLLVKEAGWKLKDMKNQRIDAANSAFFMFIISASVIVVASATLFPKGIRVNTVPELLPILEPIGGVFTVVIMVLGISAAGLSSVLPNILAVPWIIKDYMGWENPVEKPAGWLILLLVIYVTLGTVFGLKPIFLMLLSQAFLAVLLPILTISMVYLLRSKKIMGEHRIKTLEILVWVIIIGYSILMSYLGLSGVIEDISGLL